MAPRKLNILHIDSEFGWRGGQQQVIYLHRNLINKKYPSILICNPGSELEKKCIELDLPFYSVRIRGEMDFVAAYKIARLARERNVNIIQCHSGHAQTIGILTKLFLSSVKLIAVRRVDFHIKQNILSRWKYNTNLIDKIVCISENIKNVLIKDGIELNRVVTIHSGVDLSRFNKTVDSSYLKDEFNISESDILVGTVAAFVGHKDYNNLIEAASIVLGKNKNVKFIAVGDGENLEACKQTAARLGILDRFIFTGYRKDIHELLNLFDVFVLSSKKEGLGTSVLDAQAMGLPIIATKAGGIPEMIESGANGILVDKQNPEALAYAILNLITDKGLMNNLGQAAKASVVKFNVENTALNNIRLYEKLLNE